MHVLALLAAEDDSNASGGLIQIGILLLIPLAMYFLMIRPQRRRMRDQQAMQSSLEVGDEVITNAGIYGFITAFEDDIVWVEIDEDVQIRVNRSFLQGRVNANAAASSSAQDTNPTTTTPTNEKVTPTVKGVKAETAGQAADADAAERTTQE
jgi:preprotein translocase subunit YajC